MAETLIDAMGLGGLIEEVAPPPVAEIGLLLDGNYPVVRLVTFGRRQWLRNRVDVAGNNPNDGATLCQWEAHEGANQKFLVLPHGTREHPDEVLIVSAMGTGKVLDIAGPDGAGTPLMMAARGDSFFNQLWVLDYQSDGAFKLRSSRNPGLVADVAGDNTPGPGIIIQKDLGGENQLFFAEPTAP